MVHVPPSTAGDTVAAAVPAGRVMVLKSLVVMASPSFLPEAS